MNQNSEVPSPSKCELCGEPMPPGEEMFKYHGYSGQCPKPPLPEPSREKPLAADRGRLVRDEWKTQRDELYATCKRAVVALDKGAAFIASRELDAAIQWYRVVSARDTLPLNDHHPYGDVLAALRDARELIRREYPDASLAAGNWPTVKPRIDALDAAIAKAEGNRDAAFVELEHAEADVARLVRKRTDPAGCTQEPVNGANVDCRAFHSTRIDRWCLSCLLREASVALDRRIDPTRVRALVARWRRAAPLQRQIEPHFNQADDQLLECADELEAALAASPAGPDFSKHHPECRWQHGRQQWDCHPMCPNSATE